MLLRRKIYQFSLMAVVFACGSLFAASAALAIDPPDQTPNPSNLIVNFINPDDPSSNKLFEVDNFLPGDSKSASAYVENNSGEGKTIAIEAINVDNAIINTDTGERFGDALDLIIKENLDVLFDGTLTEFFNAGELTLSYLNGGANTTYNFWVTFDESVNEEYYQGKSLGFDVIIGFKGEEGGVGTNLPSGLTILNESILVTDITENSATVTWTTSYFSTSQAVYSSETKYNNGYTFDLNKENYGYFSATLEKDNALPINEVGHGVTEHSVIINGLSSGTTYYFRCISHASPPTISRNHSFTTLASADGGDKENNGDIDTPPAPLREGNNSGADDKTPSGIGGIIGAARDFVGSVLGLESEENKNYKSEAAGTADENDIGIGCEAESEFAGECGKYPKYLLWLAVLLLLVIMILSYHIYKNKNKITLKH